MGPHLENDGGVGQEWRCAPGGQGISGSGFNRRQCGHLGLRWPSLPSSSGDLAMRYQEMEDLERPCETVDLLVMYFYALL